MTALGHCATTGRGGAVLPTTLPAVRRRSRLWMAALLIALLVPWAADRALAQGAYPAAAAKGAAAPALPTLQGSYDIEEVRRLLEVAKESGFSEEQLHAITVEDDAGNVVNAWDLLAAYDRRKREEDARKAAEASKVYLSPQDVLTELDRKQPEDLNRLRDKLIFLE